MLYYLYLHVLNINGNLGFWSSPIVCVPKNILNGVNYQYMY